MKDFLININGELYNNLDAKISVFDRGFLYGDSVYETTRTFNKKPFRINKHIDRLFSSAEKISLTPTYTKDQILEEIQKTIQASSSENLSLRIVLTRGTNSDLGLDPELAFANNLIIFSKEILPNPSSWITEGVSMTFYNKLTSSTGSLPKTGNYQENIMAYNFAKKENYFDAFLINTSGFVTEGSTSNAWIIKNNSLYTPPLSDGVLEGLTRKAIFDMAAQHILPLPLIEKSLLPADLLASDECFITSTTRNVVPVSKISGQAIGNGKPGDFTLLILKKYLEFVM
jgi:branched-chain amino acid aminotransferase